jgi:hypothetical protein
MVTQIEPMSLTRCKECGGLMVSSEAKTCLHCVAKKYRNGGGRFWFVFCYSILALSISTSSLTFASVQEKGGQVVGTRENLSVFGIPMNASLQEVVSALEKKGIKISKGYLLEGRGFIVSDANTFRKVLRDEIDWTYDFWKISIPRKEKALKLLEEGKLKRFCYEYEGKKYFAIPASLTKLLDVKRWSSNPGIYPVLEDFPDIYNSQLVLECEDFPAEMDSQGITKIFLFFKNVNQNEPTCFLIRIILNAEQCELSKTLADKYGTPILYCPENPPIDMAYGHEISTSETYGIATATLPLYIKWPHPLKVGKINTELLRMYGKVNDVTEVSAGKGEAAPYRDFIHGKIGGTSAGYAVVGVAGDFLLEWRCNNTNIALSGRTTWYISYNERRELTWDKSKIFLTFYRLDYIDFPSIAELSSMYEKLYSASEEAKAKVHEAGKQGF